MAQAPEAAKKQVDVSLEEDDTFEEFPMPESEPNAAEEEAQGLWTPDWDDEDSKEDFLSKLRQELGADKMKE